MPRREAKEMHHFIWVLAYSSIMKYFSEAGPGALILKFKSTCIAIALNPVVENIQVIVLHYYTYVSIILGIFILYLSIIEIEYLFSYLRYTNGL